MVRNKMETIRIKNTLPGQPEKVLELTVSGEDTIKHIIESNYPLLFSGNEKLNTSSFDSWEQFTTEYLGYSQEFFSFGVYQDTNQVPVRIIDRVNDICEKNLSIGPTQDYLRIDDSIYAFVLNNCENEIQSIIENNGSKEDITRFFETLLAKNDTRLVVEQFLDSNFIHKFSTIVTQLIPSKLWTDIKNDEMNYYKKFIISFISEIFLLNYCIQNRNVEDKTVQQDLYRGWINEFLYKIHYLMLVTLNIPEIFLGKVNSRTGKSLRIYSQALEYLGIRSIKKCGYENDDTYYEEKIRGKSITDVYRNIFEDIPVESYYDYIGFCHETDLDDEYLSKIIHTFRILNNKLKHSASISTIESRDHLDLESQELEKIQMQIEQIKTSNLNEKGKSEKIFDLNLKKNVLLKIKYKYRDLDFEDRGFKQKNGIHVWRGEVEGHYFKISIYDLEFTIKIMIGVLIIINRMKKNSL